MRRCIIHIGTHKTGSTSLQRFLHANRDGLERAGVLYPLERGEIAHHGLFRDVSGKAGGEERRVTGVRRLSERLAATDADMVILSSELFSTLDPGHDGPATLADIAARHGFAAEAVLFVRPQPVLFNSLYTQRTKMLAEHRRFGEFADRQRRRSSYDFNLLTAPWTAPPLAAPTAIPFAAATIGDGLERAFFGALGLADRLDALSDPAPLVPVNFANGPCAVELCRRLAKLGGAARFGPNYLAVRRHAQRQADRRNWNDTGFVGLTGALCDQLHAHFGAANDAFARRLWGVSWASVFADADTGTPAANELGVADLSADRLAEVAEVYERACERFDPQRLAARPAPARLAAAVGRRLAGLVAGGKER